MTRLRSSGYRRSAQGGVITKRLKSLDPGHPPWEEIRALKVRADVPNTSTNARALPGTMGSHMRRDLIPLILSSALAFACGGGAAPDDPADPFGSGGKGAATGGTGTGGSIATGGTGTGGSSATGSGGSS